MAWWSLLGFGSVFLVGIALAMLVRRSSGTGAGGRALARLLIAEALLAGGLAFISVRPESTLDGLVVLFVFVLAQFYIISALYLRVLVTLDSPLVRPLRSKLAQWIGAGLWALGLGVGAGLSALAVTGVVDFTPAGSEEHPVVLAWGLGGGLLFVVTSFYSLAASWSARRRTVPGTAQRARATAYLAAFGTRDVAVVFALLVGEIVALFIAPGPLQTFFTNQIDAIFLIVGSLAYMALLAYGILQSQLFDLDLKVKVGIRRSTVVTIALVAVLGAAKVAEGYLNSTFGLLAGGAAAGAVLVFAPRLNKLGDKVANTAMPAVQPTSAYLQFKKIEVYKAAVESAVETGGVTAKEHAMLRTLGAKLGISATDCAALEADFALGLPV